MAKKRVSEQELERQYLEAVQRGKEREKTEPRAQSVSYDRDSNRLVINFKNGSMFAVPCELIPELNGADPSEIAEVTLLPRGAALHWEKLNQDFSIAKLMSSVFGNDIWLSELGRRGGVVSSEAKAAAARANGRKGGRPVRAKVRSEGLFEATLIEEISSPFVPATTILGSVRIAASELAGLEAELHRHQQEALTSGRSLNVTEGRLMRNEPITQAPILAHGECDPFLFNCFKLGKEAANNAELALGA